jgi:allantoin racemase
VKIHVINTGAEPLGLEDGKDMVMARYFNLAGPETEISFEYTPDAPPVIESAYEDAFSAVFVIQAAIRAERDGKDAIIINCTADTGLEACRECVSIPVVAPTMATMHLAAQLTHRFSVITFLERVNKRFEEMAWRYGLHHKLASVRSIELPVKNIITTDISRLANDLFSTGLQCYQADGAHGVILGCTDFELAAEALKGKFMEAGVDILLLEPSLVSLRLAETLVSMGIGQSKLTYPKPASL